MVDTQQTIGTEIGRKLSAKECGWDSTRILEAVLANKNSDIPLLRVIGMATGWSEYQSDYGDGESLIGQFEATNTDGDVFNGSSLYLPAYIQDMVLANLKASGEGAGVQIALDIYARYEASAATKYIFVGRSLLAADTRAVDAIKAQLGSTPMPALPAPSKG